MVHGCPVVVGGDLNVHVKDPSDASAARLSDLFHAMDMKQYVTQPTHQAGGTLNSSSRSLTSTSTTSTWIHRALCLITASSHAIYRIVGRLRRLPGVESGAGELSTGTHCVRRSWTVVARFRLLQPPTNCSRCTTELYVTLPISSRQNVRSNRSCGR